MNKLKNLTRQFVVLFLLKTKYRTRNTCNFPLYQRLWLFTDMMEKISGLMVQSVSGSVATGGAGICKFFS